MTATRSIKIADLGERTSAFRQARWNSLFVRSMRFVLPVGAVMLLCSYAVFMQRTIKIETKNHTGKINTGVVSLKSLDNLAMTNPSYEGYGKKDGSRYKVSAARAITDLSRDKPIELIEIDGAFQQSNGQKTSVTAARGVFDQKLGTLNLDGGIKVEAPNDVKVVLNSAVIDTKTSEISSDQPVFVSLRVGQVRGNAMRLDQRKREVIFRDGVAAQLRPAAVKKPGEPQRSDNNNGNVLGMGGASRSPVDITSATLAIVDKTGTARFQGNVRAVQDDRKLEAPELIVSYAGGASAASISGPGEASTASASRLQKIVARDGVNITQGKNRVQARRAEFDANAKQASLIGGVKITAPSGRSIKADRADIDTAINRVVLTGSVVAIQEQNLLRGNRLVYEQKAGRMRLTSPAVAGGAPKGDIFVRLRPPAKPGGKRPARRNPSGNNGAGLAFNTNPDAPIEIIASSLDVDDTKSNALFEGGVRARQDGFLLTTPTLKAVYAGRLGLFQPTGATAGLRKQPMKLRFIRASNPVEVTSGNDMRAHGEQAVFDVAANTVTISGNVVLRQGRQVVRGEKLLIDLKTGLSRMLTAGSEKVTAKPLTFGAPPRITANPDQRDCGGKMCAVFFPRDAQKGRRGEKLQKDKSPSRRQPSVGSGWSTSTSTN